MSGIVLFLSQIPVFAVGLGVEGSFFILFSTVSNLILTNLFSAGTSFFILKGLPQTFFSLGVPDPRVWCSLWVCGLTS